MNSSWGCKWRLLSGKRNKRLTEYFQLVTIAIIRVYYVANRYTIYTLNNHMQKCGMPNLSIEQLNKETIG